MSRDWGAPHYRRKVASELGIDVTRLDRALAELARQEQAHGGDDRYRSLSHNDRLKAFASVLDIPLTVLAGIDGVSTLLPERAPAPKRTSRARRTSSGSKAAATKRPRPKAKKKAAAKKVPMKKFPWELDAPPPRPAVRDEPQDPGERCEACLFPYNPLTGACGCT